MYMTQAHTYVHMNICFLSPLLWTELETIFCPLISGKNIRVVGGEYPRTDFCRVGNFTNYTLSQARHFFQGSWIQFEGYIEGNYLFWVFQWQWSRLPLDDGLRNHVWGLVIGGDRLTSGNQGIQIRQIWRVSRSSLGRRPGTQDRKRSLLGILGLGDIRRWSIGLVLLWFVILTGSVLSCKWEWSFL